MKTYAIIGTGGRGLFYANHITAQYRDCAQLVALLDTNRKRAEYVQLQAGGNIPIFADFNKMMDEAKPDAVIITTVDCYHCDYVIRALEHGVEVICEKPMTIDDESCRKILDAEKRTGRKITVTFNCRYMPHIEHLKEIMRSGAVGDVLNIDFEWLLDTSHGADYFRRWHRRLENSGSLLLTKATHHFDIINFLIEQDPVTVYASGGLSFYGKDRRPHGERCSNCDYKGSCEFVFKEYNNLDNQGLYFSAESCDGYYRDRCVFDGEVNIWDNMNLVVKYSGGALMSYSLIAHSPYEGWKLSISGTNGRLETSETYSGPDKSDISDLSYHTKVYNRNGDLLLYDTIKSGGVHGGGDTKMLDALLRGGVDDLLGQSAGSRDGAMSIMIGICANKSIQEGTPIHVKDLVNVDS